MASLLTSLEAAAFLRLSEQTLRHDRCSGRLGIPFLKVGRRVFYDVGVLTCWLTSQRHVPPRPAFNAAKVRKGRATKREEVEARRKGVTVSELRRRKAGEGQQ